MESCGAQTNAQPPAENRPACPWLNKERWMAAPGGTEPWGARAGQALTTICLGDGDILLETRLIGVGFFSTVMGCGVNRDLGYHWEACGPVSRWWHLNDSVTGNRNRATASPPACHSDKYCTDFHPAEPGEACQTVGCVLPISFSTSCFAIHSLLLLSRQNSSYPVDRW